MNQNQENIINASDELSFKDIVKGFKDYFFEVINSWKLLILITAPFCSYFVYKASIAPTVYPASLTFMVNEDEGGLGAMSAASGILGSLGIGGVQEYNLDKILELAKSNRIVMETLLSKVKVGGVENYLANHIIDRYNMKKTDWKKDTFLNKDFYFKNDRLETLNFKELRAIKSLHKKIVGTPSKKGIVNTTFTKATAIMTLSAESPNEELTIEILKSLYDKLGNFYVNKSIEKQKYTYEVIVRKADSLKSLLQGKEYSRARLEDGSRGLILETNKVPAVRLSRDLNMLSIMYAEAIKNAEVADFAMKSKVPFVQSIDVPFSPLSPSRPSILFNFIIGISLGLFVSIVFISIRKLLRDSL